MKANSVPGLWICTTAILCLAVDAHGIDLMGPPTATHEARQISIGVEYSYSEENVQFTDSGSSTPNSIDDMRRSIFVGRVGVGLHDRAELFFRLGTGTFRADVIEFDDSTDPVWGGGTKITLQKGERIDLGALFQWNTFDGETTGFIDAYGINAREKIRVNERHFALGATVDMEGWHLYGGPFYYTLEADVTIKEITNPRNQIRPDMEEESEFGGYIGAQFDLAAETALSIEYIYTREGSAVGTGLSWKF